MFFSPLRTVGTLPSAGQCKKNATSERQEQKEDFCEDYFFTVIHFWLSWWLQFINISFSFYFSILNLLKFTRL
jgi:hypothetical protein